MVNSTTTTQGFAQVIDDNRKPAAIFKPKTTVRLTGIETTTVRSAIADSSIVKITAVAAGNYAVTTSATDAVTTSDPYLVAGEPMYLKVDRERDYVAFMGSTVVYITTLK